MQATDASHSQSKSFTYFANHASKLSSCYTVYAKDNSLGACNALSDSRFIYRCILNGRKNILFYSHNQSHLHPPSRTFNVHIFCLQNRPVPFVISCSSPETDNTSIYFEHYFAFVATETICAIFKCFLAPL